MPMPRCALLSVLIALAGTVTAPAAPLGPAIRHPVFQPGRQLKPAVLRPATVTVLRPSRTARLQPSTLTVAPGRAGVSTRPVISQAAAGRTP